MLLESIMSAVVEERMPGLAFGAEMFVLALLLVVAEPSFGMIGVTVSRWDVTRICPLVEFSS